MIIQHRDAKTVMLGASLLTVVAVIITLGPFVWVVNDVTISYFIYCLRTIGSSGRNCSYFGTRMSFANTDDRPIDFTNQRSVLGLDNPFQLQGLTDTYSVS